MQTLAEDPHRQKTRWAIEQVLGERAILESCMYGWQEFGECLDMD